MFASQDDQPRTAPTVLIADDDAFVRSALSRQLGHDFDVVGGARDAAEAIALTDAHKPDIVIIDVDMPEGGGLRATQEIHAKTPETTIVMLSADESREMVVAMLKAGAVAYVRKGAPGHELAVTLRRSMAAHAMLQA
jgi:DNA-binding NarL/FixJ family response regulator